MSAATWIWVATGFVLTAYVLTGGADYGAGVWTALARGPRATHQRQLIERAIAPIWEANHIWLIFAIVLVFTAFPVAFAVVTTAFHIPIVVALIGIVLRGSAFIFRAYGLQPAFTGAVWRRIFAGASVVTPACLGLTLGGIASGEVRVVDGRLVSGFLVGWTSSFAVCVGGFGVALVALLAAAYLMVDAQREGATELVDDFRARVVVAEIIAGVLAAITLWRAYVDSPELFANLVGSSWSLAVHGAAAAAAVGGIVSALRRAPRATRALVALQVALVFVGLGLAMEGNLVFPDVHHREVHTSGRILEPLLWVLAAAAAMVGPALWALFRVFKRD